MAVWVQADTEKVTKQQTAYEVRLQDLDKRLGGMSKHMPKHMPKHMSKHLSKHPCRAAGQHF